MDTRVLAICLFSIQIAQRFYDRRNLRINLPVEDPISAAYYRLAIVERIPGKRKRGARSR